MTHASRSKNLRTVAHDRSNDRFVEQNLVPDRKITPSGDKPFKDFSVSNGWERTEAIPKREKGEDSKCDVIFFHHDSCQNIIIRKLNKLVSRTSHDSDFEAEDLNEPHRLNQAELIDLTRDLDLPKQKAALLASRL
ncbi:hypothetical protein TNCV_4519901 [Trichonephila clavipes]|nr:hypothetical protein TNCV_4519901 [Trichonephila clavipes]